MAAAGSGKKEVQEKYITKQLEKILEERGERIASGDDKNYIKVVNDQEENYAFQIIYPIISERDVIGAVIFLTKDEKRKFGETEQKVALSAAGFLGKQMEQ